MLLLTPPPRHVEWNAENTPLAAPSSVSAVSVAEMQPNHAP
jgi:hypothetical protein